MTTSKLQNAIDSLTLEQYPTQNSNSWTVLYGRTSAGIGARSYLYFGMPFPRGVTILSARLKLYNSHAKATTVTASVQRIGATWSANRVTWNAAPIVTGAITTLTKASAPAGAVWDFDVTAMMQTVSNGATWYGFRLSNSTSLLQSWHSSQAPNISYRPTLEIVWSDVPKAPTQLFPSAGRAVATNKPTLQFNFVDLSGDVTLDGVQVQINSTDVWTAPAFDSGDVATGIPELDLSTTAYAGMAAGATVFWRVRVKDGAGLWSLWSASTSMKYETQGTLTLNNPPWSEVLRNTVKNARAGTVVTGWGFGSAGGTAALTRVATGGPLAEAPTFARLTWSVAATALNSNLYTGAVTAGTYAMAVVPGEARCASAYIRASWTSTFMLRINYYTSTGVFLSSTDTGPLATSSPNVWMRMTVEEGIVPATAAFALVIVYQVSGTMPPINATLDMSAVMSIKAAILPTLRTYWDGDVAADTEYQFTWAGTAHASDSLLRQPLVEDATPLIDWTFTGRVQSAFQLSVYSIYSSSRMVDGVIRWSGARRLRWTSGKITSTASSYSIPAGVLGSYTIEYYLEVRVWDTISREATPDVPISVTQARTFVLKWTTATAPAANVTLTLDPNYPWATLNWTRSTMPDKWNIYRNGQLVIVYNGDGPFVTGTSYQYKDRWANPRVNNTWVVIPVVNGRGSSANTVLSGTPKARSTMLCDIEGEYPLLIWSADKGVEVEDDAFVFEPVGNAPPIVIFSATKNGLRGNIKGVISPTLQGYSAQRAKWHFAELTETKGQKLLLTMVDETIEVFIINPSLRPRIADGGVIFDISFDFYQTDFV